MTKCTTSFFAFIGCLLIALWFPSCVGQEDEPVIQGEKERLILIYAVAANNLQTNLKYDSLEITVAGPQLDLTNNKVLMYSVVNSGVCLLQELQKNSRTGKYEFVTVTDFPEEPLSTSGERISEVMEYVSANYDYQKMGLVLWSHADGWLPWFAGSTPSYSRKKSFGWDNFDGATYKTNITELAEAIPAGMFDFIWFDCCYMANIETIYQLREKTDYIVGSVLEIASDGMPYNLTMPYLLQKNADLENAAFALFSFYDRNNVPVSVSIIKTGELEQLAEVAKTIISEGTLPTPLTGLQTYQRSPITEKFYDMGQLLRTYMDITEETEQQLTSALNGAVRYKLISDYDFNGRPINTSVYSGLSMHNFVDNGSGNAEFYKILDWYKATRE